MNVLVPKLFSVIASLGAATGALSAAEQDADVASIPEPSVAVLGGLCGIIFLLWRKK